MNPAQLAQHVEVLLPGLSQALGAASLGLVVFDGHGAVTFATEVAEKLLSIRSENGVARVAAPLQTTDGHALASLLNLSRDSLPALVCANVPDAPECLIRVTGLPEQRIFLLQDLGAELRQGTAELQLMDVAAHDLRAGLVPVKTYAQMLLTGVLGTVTEKQADALKAIDHCVEKQADRIASVLDMVKAEQNRLELHREPVALGDILRRVLESAQRDLKRRNIRTVVELDPRAGLIDGDAVRLQRIFSALLARAIKQSSQDGAAGIELRAVAGLARVRVWDHGSGNQPADLAVLFQSCREQALARMKQKSMPEIDLATVFDVVTGHGGRLQAQTEIGAGTTYLVYLPLLKRKSSGPQPAPSPAEKTWRTLLACAAPRETDLLRGLLAQRGCPATAAQSGKEAIRLAREHHYPLVFVADTLADVEARQVQAAVCAQRPEDPQAVCLLVRRIEGHSPADAAGRTWALSAEAMELNAAKTLDEMMKSVAGQDAR